MPSVRSGAGTGSFGTWLLIGIFGDRATDEYPTQLLAFLTAYDAPAGTSHLGAEDNLSSDDQYLWQSDDEVEE